MEKALAIIAHYGSGKADFVIRADGELKWGGPGKKPTNAQLEQWDTERRMSIDIRNQRSDCIVLLNDSEKAVSNDPPYPADTAKWVAVRAQWRLILKSDKVVVIPDKPF